MKKTNPLLKFTATCLLLGGLFLMTSAEATLTDDVQATSLNFYSNISVTAISLLISLFSIAFTWKSIQLVLKRAEFQELVVELIRAMISVGVYLMFIQYGAEWLKAIVDSSKQLASTGASIPLENLNPGALMDLGIDLQDTMVKNFNERTGADSFIGALTNFFPALMLTFACLAILFSFAMLSFNLFLTYCEMYLIIAVAPFMFALGGLPWTKDNAMKPWQSMLAVSVKIMVLALIAKFAIDLSPIWAEQLTQWTTKDWKPLWKVISQVGSVGVLALLGPKLAAAILAGGTSMSAGDALQAGGNIGSMATGAAAIGAGTAALAFGGAAGAADLLGKGAGAAGMKMPTAESAGRFVGSMFSGKGDSTGVKEPGGGDLGLPGLKGKTDTPKSPPPDALKSFGGEAETPSSTTTSNDSTGSSDTGETSNNTPTTAPPESTSSPTTSAPKGDASGAKVGGSADTSAPASKANMQKAIKDAMGSMQGNKPGVIDHIANIPKFVPPDQMISGAAVSHVQD